MYLGDFPVAFAFSGAGAHFDGIISTLSSGLSLEETGSNSNVPTHSLVIRKEFPETFILDMLNVTDRFVHHNRMVWVWSCGVINVSFLNFANVKVIEASFRIVIHDTIC